jgi:hypothetical protein
MALAASLALLNTTITAAAPEAVWVQRNFAALDFEEADEAAACSCCCCCWAEEEEEEEPLLLPPPLAPEVEEAALANPKAEFAPATLLPPLRLTS